MTDGPSRRKVDRAREALERHDTELQNEDEADPEDPDRPPEHDEPDE